MKLKDLDIYAIGDTIQMAGAVFSGQGRTFLCMFPGEKADLPQEVLEMDLDDWKKFFFQTDVLETEIIEKSSDGTLAKIVVRKSQRQIDTRMQWRVFRRDGYRCQYCGDNESPLTVDHLVVWEMGGPTTDDNLLTSCRDCNKKRGTMPYADWLRGAFYRRVSVGLTPEIRAKNEALIATLDNIPRYMSKRSR